MKKAVFISLLVCLFLFSCKETEVFHYYTKSFFIGEESFSFEGEIFSSFTPPVGWPQADPFDSVSVRFNSHWDLYDSWEISGTRTSEKKFQVSIDLSNGIPRGSDSTTDNFYGISRFPEGFPVIELQFDFNEYGYYREGALYKELVYLSKTDYNYYYCTYIYVAEPIDLSGTDSNEGKGMFGGPAIDNYYYDLNFSKPGWYKIIKDRRDPFDNNLAFSSTKNNFFSY